MDLCGSTLVAQKRPQLAPLSPFTHVWSPVAMTLARAPPPSRLNATKSDAHISADARSAEESIAVWT
jgi:hypothetical protein